MLTRMTKPILPKTQTIFLLESTKNRLGCYTYEIYEVIPLLLQKEMCCGHLNGLETLLKIGYLPLFLITGNISYHITQTTYFGYSIFVYCLRFSKAKT